MEIKQKPNQITKEKKNNGRKHQGIKSKRKL